jgi:hypothetical protein
MSRCLPLCLRTPTSLDAVGTSYLCPEGDILHFVRSLAATSSVVGQVKRRGGLEIDAHHEIGRLLVGGFLSTKNAVDIRRRLAERIDDVNDVVNQTAFVGLARHPIDRREPVAGQNKPRPTVAAKQVVV